MLFDRYDYEYMSIMNFENSKKYTFLFIKLIINIKIVRVPYFSFLYNIGI